MCPVQKQQDEMYLVQTEYSKSARFTIFFFKGNIKICFCFSACSGMFESQLTMSPGQANLCTEVHMFYVETGVITGSGSYCLYMKGHQIHIIN